MTHFTLKMCSFLTRGLENQPFCLFSGVPYCCMSPTQFALSLVTDMQHQNCEKYSLSTANIFRRLSWSWKGEKIYVFCLWNETFYLIPFFKISVPLNKTKPEVKLEDLILKLSKCFNYICCLCTKKGSRCKTPTSYMQQKNLHIDLCVCLSWRCPCYPSSPSLSVKHMQHCFKWSWLSLKTLPQTTFCHNVWC